MSGQWPGQELAPQTAPPQTQTPALRPVLSVPDPAAALDQEGKRLQNIRTQQEIDKANAATVVGISPDLMHLTGPDFIAKLPPADAAQVKALAEGRMAFPTGRAASSPYWQQRLAEVSQYDPDFDAINYNARAGTRRDFTSGKSSANVKALNTAIGHVAHLADQIGGTASHGGDNSYLPFATSLNKLENDYSRSRGGSGITKYEQTAGALAGELTQVYRQSGGAEADIQRYLGELDPNASEDQKKGAVANILALLKSRLDALNDQYTKGMGTSAGGLDVLDQHSRQALVKYLPGFDAGPAGGGSGPNPGSTPGFDRNQTLKDTYGITPDQEHSIAAFWNSNTGNAALSPTQVKAFYTELGAPLPTDDDISQGITAAQKGARFGGFDLSKQEDAWKQKVAAEEARQEKNQGTPGIADLARQGVSAGLSDEASGVGTAIGRAIGGDFNIGDNYNLGNAAEDLRLEKARDATGEVGTGVELLGNAASLGAGGLDAMGARTLSPFTEGAIIGAVPGFGYGEGARGSIGGAAIGGAAGGALGYGGQKLADYAAGRAASAPAAANSSAAQNYAAGQKFGMNLSVGDAGGVSPKIVERMLDVQPGSGSVMNASRNELGQEMVSAVDNVAGAYGPATTFRGIGEAAQRGVQNWSGRFDKVAEKAYGAIPIKPDTPATVTNTVGALDDLTNKITSNPKLAAMMTDKKLVGYLEALQGKTAQVPTGVLDANGQPITREAIEGGGLSWNDLKQLRSRTGEEIGEQRFGEGTLKSDLRRLYGALSTDMEATATAQGPSALRAFQKANTLYKQGQDRLDSVWNSLLGPDGAKSPEAAAAIVQRIAKEGKSSGDLGKLADLRKTLKPDEWGEVSNGVLRLLGQPANSEGRQFAADTFLRGYQDMAPEARNLLFGGSNRPLRQNLDEFARVIGLVAKSGGTRNTSNTAMGLAGLTGFTVGGLPGALGQTLMSYGAAKLWTNPKFVRWATGYARMLRGAERAGGGIRPAAFDGQLKALSRTAASESAIAADALGLQQHLASVFQGGSAQAGLHQLPLAAQEPTQSSDTNPKTGGPQ